MLAAATREETDVQTAGAAAAGVLGRGTCIRGGGHCIDCTLNGSVVICLRERRLPTT